MSHTAWKQDFVTGSRDEAPMPEMERNRPVPHYREALWAARLALLFSILSAALAFVSLVLSAISICYSLR